MTASFLRTPEPRQIKQQDAAIEDEYGGDKAETCLVTQDGERICYTVCNRTEGRALAGIGALFLGMISTGLGELNGYFLLRRCWAVCLTSRSPLFFNNCKIPVSATSFTSTFSQIF